MVSKYEILSLVQTVMTVSFLDFKFQPNARQVCEYLHSCHFKTTIWWHYCFTSWCSQFTESPNSHFLPHNSYQYLYMATLLSNQQIRPSLLDLCDLAPSRLQFSYFYHSLDFYYLKLLFPNIVNVKIKQSYDGYGIGKNEQWISKPQVMRPWGLSVEQSMCTILKFEKFWVILVFYILQEKNLNITYSFWRTLK